MSLEEWKTLFQLSDRHGFVIASDECYSEIYLDEGNPPLGGLQAARRLGRDDYRNLVAFSSLSKRSNVPGLRSGFVGDAALIGRFLLYRTYHGSAMSPIVTAGSIAAWTDEEHVKENRRMYREKFDAVLPILRDVLNVDRPQASFYLWAGTSGPDTAFVRDLYGRTGVTVLPGSFLARDAHGVNPGENRCAWRWSRRWPNACRPPSASRISSRLPFDQPLFEKLSRYDSRPANHHRKGLGRPDQPVARRRQRRSARSGRAHHRRSGPAACAWPKRSMTTGSCINGSRRPCCCRSA